MAPPRRLHKPTPCPYCNKFFEDEEGVNRHVSHSANCRSKRQRVIEKIASKQKVYDAYDPEDIPRNDEPSPFANIHYSNTENFEDSFFQSNAPPTLSFEEVRVDESLSPDESEDDGDADDAELLVDNDDGDNSMELQPEAKRDVDPLVRLEPYAEVYPGAACVIDQSPTRFEKRRKREGEKGESDGWGPTIDEAHHELAEWLMTAGISQAKMDSYFKLQVVRITMSSSLLVTSNPLFTSPNKRISNGRMPHH